MFGYHSSVDHRIPSGLYAQPAIDLPGPVPKDSSTNAPWWGPSRPLIVSDPAKLTYFARANMVRSGLRQYAGAAVGGSGGSVAGFAGLGDIIGNRILPLSVAHATNPAPVAIDQNTGMPYSFDPQMAYGDSAATGAAETGGNTSNSNGTATIDQFIGQMNSLFNRIGSGAQSMVGMQQPAYQQDNTMTWVIGAGVAVGAFLLLKKAMK